MRASKEIWLVQAVSLSRLLGALVFASMAFQNVPLWLVAGIYIVAMCSDLIDGYLARRLAVVTYFGKVLDLVSDKSLTIVSLLYAAARGVSVLPLSLIAAREIIMIGGRIIIVEGNQLLPTSKLLGGALAFVLWTNTLLLLISAQDTNRMKLSNSVYWICAFFFTANLLTRLCLSAPRIRAALLQKRS